MRRRRRGPAIALVIIAIVAAWFVVLRASRSGFDPAAVVVQVRQLNQLATARYTIQKVVAITEQRQPVGSESILLIMQANVDAGIDLSALTEKDVSRRVDGTIVVRLPPAKLLNVVVDEKQTKVWDRRKTWWTPWVPYSLDLEQRARVAATDAIRQAAIESGILKQAERNAEASIRGLLNLAGARSVLVLPAGAS
jgi:hypothetical protein